MIRHLSTEDELRQVAAWLHAEWGYARPGTTVEDAVERIRGRMNTGGLPTCFVAEDGGLAGTASFVECDMATHPELAPWLGSLYVRADRRGRGIGEALVARVLEEARRLGYRNCYLWTDKAEAFYAARGWRTILREKYRGEDAIVMEVALG